MNAMYHFGSAVVLAAGMTAVSSHAVELKLADVLPDSHSWNIAAEGFAKEVAEKTDGRVMIKVFAGGQLGDENTLVQGLQIGSVQMGIIGCGSFQPVEPKFGIVELPYAWSSRENAYAAYDGKLGAALEEAAQQHHLKILSWWENGFRHITNNRGPINTPEDLRDLKIRVTPDKMRLDAFTALGASPAPLAFSELYSALQQGVFNAQENPLAIIDGSSLYEVQDYLSLTGHIWGPACLTISDTSWTRLSPEDQVVVQEAADHWRDEQRAMMQEADAGLIDKLKSAGMQVNEVDVAPFKEAVQDVWKTYKPVYGEDLFTLIQEYNQAK